MSVTTLLAISLGAILTNNFIFAQFLGICPFLGVSKKIDPRWCSSWKCS